MTREEHIQNISAQLKEIPKIKRTFPAFCGAQDSHTIPLLKKYVKSNDFIIVSGTALYDHPEGPTEGAKLLRKTLN
ncbi:MAG: hypothetical protein HYW50_00545, partial [Candidatus Diapherotrites archaeon]|nr:hypothetical protein [Candidatus Diapherotrites archaeon]